MRRKSPVELMDYVIVMLREEIAREKANGCPFTPEELKESAAELDEESAEWVAYCTRCGGAIEASCDHRLVLTAALTHVHLRPGHQVIVGTEILGRSYAVGAEP